MKLSPRMEAVIALLASGHRQKEIPDLLKISAATVKTYVLRICARLSAKTPNEAVSIYATLRAACQPKGGHQKVSTKRRHRVK